MRRSSASLLTVVGLFLATLAFAQGKKPAPRAKPQAKPQPAAAAVPKSSEGPYDAKPSESRTPQPESASPPRPCTGHAPAEPPAAAAPPSDAGVRASPLNPRPEEFPDGGGQITTSADLEKVLGEIATLRARVAAIADTLFHSRIV